MSQTFYAGPLLAPMVRTSNPAMRALCSDYGASACFTDVVVCKALLNAVRTEIPETGSVRFSSVSRADNTSAARCLIDLPLRTQSRTADTPEPPVKAVPEGVPDLLSDNDHNAPVIVQLAAGDVDLLVQAASVIALDCDGIDLNLGCNKEFASQDNLGACLLRDQDKIFCMITALRGALGPRYPLSVKIRLLNDEDQTAALLQRLLLSELNAVSVNMRRPTDDNLKAPADWALFFRTLESVYTNLLTNGSAVGTALHTYVIANGDLTDMPQIAKFLRIAFASYTRLLLSLQQSFSAATFQVVLEDPWTERQGFCFPLMLARGAVRNASIFRAVRTLQKLARPIHTLFNSAVRSIVEQHTRLGAAEGSALEALIDGERARALQLFDGAVDQASRMPEDRLLKVFISLTDYAHRLSSSFSFLKATLLYSLRFNRSIATAVPAEADRQFREDYLIALTDTLAAAKTIDGIRDALQRFDSQPPASIVAQRRQKRAALSDSQKNADPVR